MAHPPGMEFHGSSWRVTKRVPQDLLAHYNPKKFFRYQTGVTDRKAADALAWKWLGDLADEFQRIRETGSPLKQTITPEEISYLVRLMIRSSLEADEDTRAAGEYEDDEAYSAALARLDTLDAETREALSRRIFRGDLPMVVEDWLWSHGYNVSRDSTQFKTLCLEFAKGRAEIIKARQSRNGAGDWVETPPVPVLAPPIASASASSPKLSEVIKHFLGKQKKDAPMYKKFVGATTLLLEVLGDRSVSTLKQKEIEDFFALLCRLPPRWKDRRRQLGKGALELAAMDWPECINKKTFVDSYMAALRPFFCDAARVFGDQGFPRHLTTDGIKYSGAREGGERKQRPMRPQELKRLFEGPEFSGFAEASELEHCYWLPLLGLFTGARVNELCQLNPQCDIQEEEGIWFFDITEDSETDARVSKSVKNKPSRRRTPIHSELVRLGFLTYYQRMKKQGHALLFPQWPPTRGKASGTAEKWFRGFLEDLGLRDETPGKCLLGFHCWRSTFLTRADHLDIPKPGTLTGHSQGDTGANRGEDGYKAPVELGKNRDKMERISFDVDIPALRWRT